MEDLKAYIESGTLELYVLGDLSESERIGVERMLEQYPELQHELREIEKALEGYSNSNAISPPENLRSKILNSLETESQREEPQVIGHNRSLHISNFYKYAFAASVALLLLSAAALVNLSSQLKESRNQIVFLQQRNQQFSSRVSYMDKQLQEAKQTLEVFHSPDQYKLVTLKGTSKAPSATLLIAFNPEKEIVMIDLTSLKMPQHDSLHQYQLWALQNGIPIDLGVFDSKGNSSGMLKMKSIKTAQAFAVTLEIKGGSKTPTMDQMMAMGAI